MVIDSHINRTKLTPTTVKYVTKIKLKQKPHDDINITYCFRVVGFWISAQNLLLEGKHTTNEYINKLHIMCVHSIRSIKIQTKK